MVKHTEIVRMVGVFAPLSDAEIAKMAELLLERRFRKGQVIFQEGEEGDALYIVESGRLKATAMDLEGHQRILALYGQGDFFGEMALLSGQSRSATISSVTDCTLLVLRKEDFEALVRSNIRVMRPMLEVISERKAQNIALFASDKTEETIPLVGKIITVCSPKGGVGRTSVAVNLAIALKEATSKQVALVDASLGLGGVGPLMGLVSDRSTNDLVAKINDLTPALFESSMYPHPSGVRVLAAATKLDFSFGVTGYHIHMIIAKLTELFDYVVVDTSIGTEESSLAILDASDLILLLTTVEIAALHSVKAFLSLIDSLGYHRDKILLVANRADFTGGITIDEAETIVGQHFKAGIVSDGMLATLAGNKGLPVVQLNKTARLSQDLRDLTEAVLATLDGRPVAMRVMPTKVQVETWQGETSPVHVQSIFNGLGVMFAVTISLLFVNYSADFALQGAKTNYPYTVVAGVMLGSSVFLGAFVALRLDREQKRGWSLGLILGLLYGLLTAMVTAAISSLIADAITVSWETVVLAIPVYGALGLLGGIVGAIGRGKRS